MRKRKKITLALIILVLLSGSFLLAHFFNTNFGAIEVKLLKIQKDEKYISSLFYQSKHIDKNLKDEYSAVILMHGVLNAKETMSGLAMELAKKGIVTLTIDAYGHGNTHVRRSETNDVGLGFLSALEYLQSLSYINNSKIGLIGHSMGANALRTVLYTEISIASCVFIAGGLDNDSSEMFNATFESNLLYAIGKSDELFDLNEVKEELMVPFGSSKKVESDTLYGSFRNRTARKLIAPNTIHMLEPYNRKIVEESVNWMLLSFNPLLESDNLISKVNLTYIYRDILLIISFFFLLAELFVLLYSLSEIPFFKSESKEIHETENIEFTYNPWKTGLFWGVIHILTFIPATFMSFVIPFPLSFGSMAIFWMVFNAIIGVIFQLIVLRRYNKKSSLKKLFHEYIEQFKKAKGFILGILLFIILYVSIFIFETIFNLNPKIIVPIFSNFTLPRLGYFFLFSLVFLPYFLIDSFLHLKMDANPIVRSDEFLLKRITTIVLPKVIPFILILLIVYIPLLTFNYHLLSGSLGFTLQFLFFVIILFPIYSLVNISSVRNLNSYLPATLLNTLMFSWTLAILLSYN